MIFLMVYLDLGTSAVLFCLRTYNIACQISANCCGAKASFMLVDFILYRIFFRLVVVMKHTNMRKYCVLLLVLYFHIFLFFVFGNGWVPVLCVRNSTWIDIIVAIVYKCWLLFLLKTIQIVQQSLWYYVSPDELINFISPNVLYMKIQLKSDYRFTSVSEFCPSSTPLNTTTQSRFHHIAE